MNRILRRPMFRMGGSTSGITLGLDASRQNYQNAGSVVPFEEQMINSAEQNQDKINAAAMKVIREGANNMFNTGSMQSTGERA